MMVVDAHPYPFRKASGEEWLGEIPAHWEVRRVRTLADIVNGATPSSNTPEYWDGDLLWLTPNDLGALRNRYILTTARRISLRGYESCGTALAPSGSVAISIRAPIGHLGILGDTACVNQGCRLLVPNESIASEYLYYGLEITRSELESLGQGSTFNELSRDALADFRLALPPIEEQRAVVRFLDYADRRIRRYIRAKEKLIALLEEQKQAIVHQAVTGQIDVRTGRPYPAYKDSEVESLGKVPEHWEVRRVATVADMRVSNVDKHVKDGEQAVRLCNYVDVYHNDRVSADVAFMAGTAKQAEIQRFRLAVGDVLVTKDSEDWTDIGVPALVEYAAEDLVCGYHLAMLRPNGAFLHGGYLFRALGDARVAWQFRVAAAGVTRYGLSQRAIKSMRIPLPPLPEQRMIALWLDRALDGISACSTAAAREVELLREYRTRLIADVITGKVDVRGVAGAFPVIDTLTAENPSNDTAEPSADPEAVLQQVQP